MFLIKHTLHHQYSLWFFRFMWLQQYFSGDRLRRWALVSAVGLSVVIGVQFLYPKNFAMPRTRISGAYLGFQSKQAIASKVNKYNSETLVVATQTQKMKVTPEKVGITVDGAATAEKVLTYTWRERLIPFSLIFSKRHVDSYNFSVNESAAQAFATELKQQDKGAQDAKLKIEGVNVIVEASQNGYTYEPAQVQEQLETIKLTNKLEATVTPTAIEPNITTTAAEAVAEQIKQRIATPFKINAAGETLTIDASTLASWIVITQAPDKKTITASYDRTKIKNKLLSLSSKVYIAGANNTVTIVDGETKGSSGGSSGQALLLDASIDEVIAAATSNASQATGKVQAVTPSTQFVRTYTRSSKGVQALINYWAQSHGGTYGISLKSTSGDISASYNGSKQFTSASIYKLYLAYVVYSKVEAGTLSLSAVENCIDAMIVRSDNACAASLGNTVGWQANDGMLRSKGYGSTTLTSGAHLTTANDAALWLNQLATGSLTSSEYNSSLLSMMKRQIYRSGIPSGTKSSTVANKVGFLGGLNHDAAIIYSPKGTYVLSVMSSGSSFSQIADLASEISAVMNQ